MSRLWRVGFGRLSARSVGQRRWLFLSAFRLLHGKGYYCVFTNVSSCLQRRGEFVLFVMVVVSICMAPGTVSYWGCTCVL